MSIESIIYLTSRNHSDRQFFEIMAQTTNADLRLAGNLSEVQSINSTTSIFADCATVDEVASIDSLISRLGTPAHFCIILNPSKLSLLEQIRNFPRVNSIIVRSNFDQEGSVEAKMFSLLMGTKSLDPEPIGDNAKTFQMNILQSSDKQSVVARVQDMLQGEQWDARKVLPIVLAADELVMNAIFCAPVDQSGDQIFAKLPRSSSISIESRFGVSFGFAVSQKQAIVIVRDKAGSLNRSVILKHLAKVASVDSDPNVELKVSSGLGLAMIFKTGASLKFYSKRGELTEISAVFTSQDTIRKYRNQAQLITLGFD